MSYRVTVEQASANALAAWLATQLPEDVDVQAQWPDPDVRMPDRIVTIVAVGDMTLEWCDPEVVSQVANPAGGIDYRWRIAESTQKFQLDVWTAFADGRDDILARLAEALNAGTTPIGGNEPIASQGVVVALADGWEGTGADFVFDSRTIDDQAADMERTLFRGIYRGECHVSFSIVANAPQLRTVRLKTRLTEASVPALYDVLSVTSSTTTFSQEP